MLDIIKLISFYFSIEILIVLFLAVVCYMVINTIRKKATTTDKMELYFDWRMLIFLGVIAVITFIAAKLYFQNNVNSISVESDLVWYDAKLLNIGLVPYKDFVTREPLLLVIASMFIRLFGSNQVLLFNIYWVFLLGYVINIYRIIATFFNKKVAFVGSILALISPLFLKFPSPNYIFYGAIYLFLISLSIFLLVKAHKTERLLFYFLYGLALSLTIHTYRGAIPFLLLLPIVISILTPEAKAVKKFLTYQAGVIIGYAVPILALYSFLDIRWINGLLQADKAFLIILLSFFVPLFIKGWFYITKKMSAPQNILLLLFTLIFITFSFSYFNTSSTTIADKMGVINDYIRYSGYYLFISLFLVLNIFLQAFFNKVRTFPYLTKLLNFGLFCLFIIGTVHPERGTSYFLELPLRVFLYAILFIGLCHLNKIVKLSESFYAENKMVIIPALMIILFLLSNIFFIEWVDHYVINLIFPSTLITIYFLYFLYKKQEHLFIIQIVSLIALFYSFTVLFFYRNNYNTSEINSGELTFVLNYLQQERVENQYIFTADPTFAFRSNNLLIGHISHPLIYTRQEFWDTYDPFNAIKSPAELIDEMKARNLQFIIVDQRTRSIFLRDLNPNIRDFINENYSQVGEFETIQILKKN